MISSPDETIVDHVPARFALWPLPDLRGSHGTAGVPSDSADIAEDQYQRGFEVGKAAGIQEAKAQLEPTISSMQRACQALIEARERMDADNEATLHSLAFAIAEHVLQQELATNPQIIATLVRRALDAIVGDGPIDVRLNPADLEALEAVGTTNDIDRGSMRWIADATIERGGCVIETPHRIVDGRLETVFAELKQRVANA